MSTTDEVRIQAQTISGIPIDSSTALVWVQDQVRTISYKCFRAAKYVVEEAVIDSLDEPYTPENEIVQIDRIIKSNQAINSYETHGGQIYFRETGTYTIRYYALPTIPATTSEAIDMPAPYVNALKFFLAARIRARLTGQSDSNAVSFYEEYNNHISEAEVIMKRMDGRRRTMPTGRRGL